MKWPRYTQRITVIGQKERKCNKESWKKEVLTLRENETKAIRKNAINNYEEAVRGGGNGNEYS